MTLDTTGLRALAEIADDSIKSTEAQKKIKGINTQKSILRAEKLEITATMEGTAIVGAI